VSDASGAGAWDEAQRYLYRIVGKPLVWIRYTKVHHSVDEVL